MGVSSHFSAYPFVVTAESELSKQAFVSALLKAYQALKREGDYVRKKLPYHYHHLISSH